MLENLKLALKKQKKLIIIFLLTIFVPSISLSIFGIRAIRNERFRLAKQIENDHKRAAELLKSRIGAQFEELDSLLLNLARSPLFLKKDAAGIKNLFEVRFADNPQVDQVFVAYDGAEAWFPLFQPNSCAVPASPQLSTEVDRQLELEAQTSEFKDKNYITAVSRYRELSNSSADPNFKVQMLTNVSRCLIKAEAYKEAIQNYQKVCEEYPDSVNTAGVPIALFSQMQIADCYKKIGDFQSSLNIYVDLYKDILNMRWPLKEAQFKTYADLAEEKINNIFFTNQADQSMDDDEEEFLTLKKLQQERLEEWHVIADIDQNIIPEFRDSQGLSTYRSLSHQFHKTLNEKTYLLSFVQIPDSSEIRSLGLLGAKVDERFLLGQIIPDVFENSLFDNTSSVVLSQLSGKILFGDGDVSEDLLTATEFFEDNFPPWKIEIFRTKGEALGVLDLKRNFYFWTILTLIVVLVSGSVLISRTIAQEMAVLRLKSDFVSSVSHEFKSPLTSIKSLAERLRDGKVEDSERMQQYFSVICQDTDRLTQLVRNILDFSKIEEGKKEYEFAETDVAQLVTQQIEYFKRSEYGKGFKIRTDISDSIPHLELDSEALSQAFNNLLDNAAKFSSEKKEIDVHIKKDDTNVFIEVSDRGIGIPPKDLDRIFEKFYQGRDTLHKSSKGTGLGLTLVKHTVEAHGGRLVVNSRIGEGSTFSLILPIRTGKK
ncbi:ATP-binding protein [Acidobacteriota bacterium]